MATQLEEMLRELHALCPRACPSVLPSGYDDRAKGVALAALCGASGGDGKAERAALAFTVERGRRGRTTCELSGEEVESEKQLRFVSFWDLLPAKMHIRLRRCAFVSLRTALMLDPLLLLERFSANGADENELRELAVHFCSMNGHSEVCSEPVRALERFQQICSLAIACRTVAGSLGKWHVRDTDGGNLRRPVHEVAAELLGVKVTTKPTGSAKSPRKAAGRKPVESAPAHDKIRKRTSSADVACASDVADRGRNTLTSSTTVKGTPLKRPKKLLAG